MTTQGYALPNAWEQAAKRLELLEACHDAASIRRASELGVGPGWDCLEAGAGHGSFARWLAGAAAPGGSVVAADLDTRLLREQPGLSVRQIDVAAEPLPRGAFDFVHTRLMLIHVPERDVALTNLVAALRPGGVIMLEEDDTYPIEACESGPYRDAWDAFAGLTVDAGLDPAWARTLPARLRGLGLADIDAEVDVQFFPGGSTPARFWSLTWEQARERRPEIADTLDRGREALTRDDRWFHGPAKVIAWGFKPR